MINIQEMKVLIVDDMPSMCKFIHKMMRNIGYGKEFVFANSGREALEQLKKQPVDLVLLDYNMPEMSGSEVLNNIRGDRDHRDTPVIMVTAEAYSDFVAEVGESEVDAYILKPITMKLLEEKVSFVIDKFNNPPPMLYHLKRARAFEDTGDLDSAIQEVLLAKEANPEVTRPIRELGYYYFKKNDLKEAEKWLLKAAEMNKLDVIAFHYLGEIYLKWKDIEKAAFYLEKAMRISPRHLKRGIHFGKTLVQMKIIPKAIQVFEKTLDYAGNPFHLREEIANFCIIEEVDEYAVKLLRSLVGEQPNRSDLLFKLAVILEKSGEFSKAITHLVRASEIDKDNLDIKIRLAKNYLTLKKPILAEKPLREVINKNPDNELAQELLKQCA
ncbi:MAG: response regulator [Deltaproteobacteria bacterium]|nr:response regulator [Deltaproteobacteria bacterium]